MSFRSTPIADGRAHAEEVWGTLVSIRVFGDPIGPREEVQAIGEIIAWLHRVDELLSTYRRDSELSLWRSGALGEAQLSPEVREVLDLAEQVEIETDGDFEPRHGGGLCDPTGLTQGWAIDRALELALAYRPDGVQISAGEDLIVLGKTPAGRNWRVGVEDPEDATRIFDVVAGSEIRLATSSGRGRGGGIRRRGNPAAGTLSASVVGPELARADGYATAAFAAGRSACTWLNRVDRAGYASLLVFSDRSFWASPGWPGSATA